MLGQWIRENPGIAYPTITLILGLMSTLIKLGARVRTSEEMAEMKRLRPRMAAVAVILGVIGNNLIDFLDAMMALCAGRWPGHHPKPADTNYADIPPIDPNPPPGGFP